MLTAIVEILTRFIYRLTAGEPLAIFQLIIFIVLAFFVYRTWMALMKMAFFRIALIILFCCLAFGFLLAPEEMMDLVDLVVSELTRVPS